ncbi:MAG: zf-HC2 domain-containing protein [Clostridia bacterium]|nr:zf-HC2 domain-containing protein [Clostridia bacterium]
MNCNFKPDLLQDYLEGIIDPIERIFVEEHLKVCRECRKELSDMKLLFWELEGLKKSRVEVPAEVRKVRESALEKVFNNCETSMNLKRLMELQRKNFSNAGLYLKFIPGVKTGEKYLKNGLKKAPSLALKLSGSALKGGFKLMQMRFQT